MDTRPRPVFLNPLQIDLPVTATASLAHRISGVLLALALPFLVYALSRSLSGPEEYAELIARLSSVPVKLLLLLLAWALAHHTVAGVRHLLFDAGIGTEWRAARTSAWVVHGLAVLATLVAAGALL